MRLPSIAAPVLAAGALSLAVGACGGHLSVSTGGAPTTTTAVTTPTSGVGGGSSGATGSPPATTGSLPAVPVGTPGGCPLLAAYGPETVPVPVGYLAVAAEDCAWQPRPSGNGGTQEVRVVQRATADLAPLVAALRQPDEARKPDEICPAIAEIIPVVALEAADGRWLLAHFPITSCGFPQPAAMTVLDRLPWAPLNGWSGLPGPVTTTTVAG